jgi:hypothetical protein
MAGSACLRPELTGWAQIKGGRQISPVDKFALDVWYALDLEILLGAAALLIFGERVKDTAIVNARRYMQLAAGMPDLTIQQKIS